jgi:hypothetical protein
MPKGMAVPIAVSHDGGAMLLDGPVVIGQNVVLALIPAGSLHPFHQNITPDEDLIFEIKDMRSGGLYVTHVYEFFAEMERQGYARLFPGGRGIVVEPSSARNANSGDMIVTIRYVNLETNKNEQVRFPISAGEK